MVAEAILTFKNEGKCSIWASSLQNFACGACNGYVTVRKRSVFVFLFWGGRLEVVRDMRLLKLLLRRDVGQHRHRVQRTRALRRVAIVRHIVAALGVDADV